jgi:anti-anti-sigma factor
MNLPIQGASLLQSEKDILIIELRGKITDDSRQNLITLVEQALQLGTRRLIVDFQNIDFIDCSGICALVEAVVMASRKKTELTAYNASKDVLAILKLTGLDQQFSAPGNGQTFTSEDRGKKTLNGQNWSFHSGPLRFKENVPPGFLNLNVNGRHLMGPLQGFGQLWQKTYSMTIDAGDLSPTELVTYWKRNFGQFWPQGNRIFIPGDQISLGKTGLLTLSMGPGLKLVTGMMVMYEDENSFAFLTPQGHMYAGWISFSAFLHENQITAQIRALIRASDPVYELGFRLGFGHRKEHHFWRLTLENLAAHFGLKGIVQQKNLLIDPGMQWKSMKNLWYNAAIRTTFHRFLTPLRWLAGRRPKLHESNSQ